MVYQIILIDLQLVVVEMIGKIKFDSTPFLRFVRIISFKNAGYMRGR